MIKAMLLTLAGIVAVAFMVEGLADQKVFFARYGFASEAARIITYPIRGGCWWLSQRPWFIAFSCFAAGFVVALYLVVN